MTIQELNNQVIKKLEANRNNEVAFSDHLCQFLSDYQDLVCKCDFASLSDQLDVVKTWCNGIMDSLKAYEEANIIKAIETIRQLLNQHADYLKVFVISSNSNNIWYRMRKLDPYVRRYYANEMFHVPFESIGKLGNQRFSISGYPCLYLGNSVWSCWEEMHEPDMAKVCVSRLEAVGEFKLLDLSWPNDQISDDENNNDKIICTWPLIIACSIRTLYPQDSFKPEYIIPQLVMMAIKNDSNYQGCTYTSTQGNKYFGWGYDKLLNAAIPVVKIQKKGLCPELTSKFRITDSTKGEYISLEGEMVFSHFEDTLFATTANGNYEDSYFGNIERLLKNENKFETKQIITI